MLYNTLLSENGYYVKYELENAQLFVIEGMDKVQEVIEMNCSQKLTKYKITVQQHPDRERFLFSTGTSEAVDKSHKDYQWGGNQL